MFLSDKKLPISSWNKIPSVTPQKIFRPYWPDECHTIIKNSNQKYIVHGLGRSYGDCCLLGDGNIICTEQLSHLIHFDAESGILRVEAGVTLADILQYFMPRGWSLPVVPGTKFVTVGGAIANDIHGKNHHHQGTFGCHVIKIGLLRSDCEDIIECSLTQQTELLNATIGGMGLTGLIVWAEILLMRVDSPFVLQDTLPFHRLEEYFLLSAQSERDYDYTVAWVDCQARGKSFGRGVLMRANWCASNLDEKFNVSYHSKRRMPCHLPNNTLNRFTMTLFNQYYFWRKKRAGLNRRCYYESFFFPLDGIADWYKIYGKRGFYQYQCVVPQVHATESIKALLYKVAYSGQGSFLAVLKNFGDRVSPGVLSFPLQGTTLTLDFPNSGAKVLTLLNQLDEIVLAAGGRVYLAKDARLSAETFKQYYPQWERLQNHQDPLCSSGLWQRLTGYKT